VRGFARLAWTDFKLYLREPIGTFFTLAFPPMLVVLFGAMYGNAPSPQLGGHGSMDVSMPGYTAMILGTVGFLGVPIVISGYRESGVLRRFRATPIRPLMYIAADVVSNMVMTLLGMVALVAMGWLLYRVRFAGNLVVVIGAVVYSGLAMYAVGYLIGSVAPSARTAQVIGMVIFYPMMFLSGAAIPLEVMPATIRRIADWLPLTYAVRLLKGLWFGDAWQQHLLETAVLGGVLVLCAGLSARFFRWD
jgi:ABC-2 type transport system permease protein